MLPLRQITKLAAVAITGALALAATGCGGSSSDKTDSKDTKNKGIGLAFDIGGRGDHSFNDAAFAGYSRAMKDFNLKGSSLVPREGESDDDKVQRLVQLAREGYNPVIGVGFVYATAVQKAAKQFPNTNFAVIDDATVKADNVANLVFNEEQGSFLVGVAAALKSKTHHVGFIGGVKTPLIEKFEAGYRQGVDYAKKGTKVDVKYLSSPPDFKGFNDAPGGRNAANGMLDAGADVVYAAAGASGTGAIQTISEKKKWVIGVDSDQYQQKDLDPYKGVILTSMVKDAEGAVYAFVKSVVQDKKPQFGVQQHGLSDDGVRYATSNPVLTDDKAMVEKLEAAKKQIIDGTIKVKTTV